MNKFVQVNPKNMWEIYYDKDLETRIILNKFNAKSKKEALKYLEEYKKTSNDELSHTWKITNRSEEWWRVYHDSKNKNRTDFVFVADGRDEAEKKYLEFVKESGEKGVEYFYTSAFNVCHERNKDGSYTMNHMFCMDDNFKEDKMIEEYRKGYQKGMKETERKYLDDLPYYAKTGHSKFEWYDIGHHILDDLLFNVPILIEKVQSFPNSFNELAAKKTKTKLNSVGNCIDEKKEKEVHTLAFKMWKDELANFLHHLRLYTYYSNYGISDPNVKWEKEYDSKYKNTLPYFKYTKDFDYKKLGEMIGVEYEFIMNWLKEHMLELWD